MTSQWKQRSLARDSAWSVVSGLIGQSFLILSGALAARYLGPDQRGNFAIIALTVGLVSSVGSIGLPLAFAHQLASGELPTSTGVRNAWRTCGLQVLLLCGIYAIFLHFVFPNYFPSVAPLAAFIATFAIPGLLAASYGMGILQGIREFRALSILRIFQPGAYALLLLLIFPLAKNLPFVVSTWSLASLLVGAGFVGTVLHISRPPLKTVPSVHVNWKNLYKFGGRSLIGTLNPLEALRLDQIALALFSSPGILGYYVVAQALTNLPRLIAFSAGLVLFPSLAAEEVVQKRRQLFKASVLFVTGGSTVLVAMLIIAAPILIVFFFGKPFAPSIAVAQVLLVGSLFGSVRKTICDGLGGLGYAAAGTISELMMYPWFIALSLILVPKYQGVGMAISVSAAHLVSLVTALALLWRRRAARAI